jgi:hypothetical protein
MGPKLDMAGLLSSISPTANAEDEMAKQPETVDRFEIIASVSKDQLGHVMAALITAGIPPEMLQSRMVTDVLNYKKTRKDYDVGGEEFLQAWMKDSPTFHRSKAGEHFKANGRTIHAADIAIYRLRDAGKLRALGDGNYQSADVKAIAPPKTKVKAKVKAKNAAGNMRGRTRTHYDTPNKDFLLAKLRMRKSMTTKEMEEYFVANGRKAKSVGALFAVLTAMHKTRRVGQGVYALVKKVKLTPRIAPAAKPNGSAVEGTTTNV